MFITVFPCRFRNLTIWTRNLIYSWHCLIQLKRLRVNVSKTNLQISCYNSFITSPLNPAKNPAKNPVKAMCLNYKNNKHAFYQKKQRLYTSSSLLFRCHSTGIICVPNSSVQRVSAQWWRFNQGHLCSKGMRGDEAMWEVKTSPKAIAGNGTWGPANAGEQEVTW